MAISSIPWARVGAGALTGGIFGGLIGGELGSLTGLVKRDNEEALRRRALKGFLYGAVPGALYGGLYGGLGIRGGRSTPPPFTPYAPRGSIHPKDVDWLRGVKTKAEATKRYRANARAHHLTWLRSATWPNALYGRPA